MRATSAVSDERPRRALTLFALTFANAAEAVEVLEAGYLLNLLDAKSDWQAWLSAGVYCGMLVGGLVAGAYADDPRFGGRRRTLTVALAVAAAGAALAALAPHL